MEYRTLGSTDLKVSCVGLGGNNFGGRLDLAGTQTVVRKAVDLGVNLIDTADTYGNRGGSEEDLGRVLGSLRKSIVLATKFGSHVTMETGGAAPAYIKSAVEGSLRRLKTDWIDLYQIHNSDPVTPIEDTLRTLDDLVKQGKVRYIGCSNFSAAELDEAQQTAQTKHFNMLASCQNQYSLLVRDAERDVIPAIERNSMGLIPYAPLAGGILTGKYAAGTPLPTGGRMANMVKHRLVSEENFRIVEQLGSFCTDRGHTLLDLSISWLLAHAVVTSVIAGAMSPTQLEQNVHAASWELSVEEMAEVDRITNQNRFDRVYLTNGR